MSTFTKKYYRCNFCKGSLASDELPYGWQVVTDHYGNETHACGSRNRFQGDEIKHKGCVQRLREFAEANGLTFELRYTGGVKPQPVAKRRASEARACLAVSQ